MANDSAVTDTATASTTYFRPSCASALKKLGTACKPTENMNRENPKVEAAELLGNPKCPSSKPVNSTPVVEPIYRFDADVAD